MKKTKQTMLTAALLSAALAMQGELSYLSGAASAVTEAPEPADSGMRLMQGVYGPPPARTTTEAEEQVTTTTEAETTISETTTSVTPMQSPEPMYGPPNIKGDIDENYDLNIADYVLMKDIVASGKTDYYTDWAADLNHDDKIDKADLQMFEHFFFGLTSYPEEKYTVPVTEPVTEPVSEAVTSPKPTPIPVVYGPPPALTEPSIKPTVMGTVYGPPPAYYDQK